MARADRMREKYKQHQRATENALSNLHRAKLRSIADDDDEVSEVTLGKEGLKAKGVPSWAVGIAVIVVALAGSAWLLLAHWPK